MPDFLTVLTNSRKFIAKVVKQDNATGDRAVNCKLSSSTIHLKLACIFLCYQKVFFQLNLNYVVYSCIKFVFEANKLVCGFPKLVVCVSIKFNAMQNVGTCARHQNIYGLC